MNRLFVYLVAAVVLSGCSSPLSGNSSSVARPTAPPGTTTAKVPTAGNAGTRTPTVVADRSFVTFVRTLCGELARGDAGAITAVLMHYQYNSGLRWGMLGDGEGHTDDPSLMTTWLQHARPHCVSYSAGTAGHGAMLASGWAQPGHWSIIEMDVINAQWKINDFTFGSQRELARAMQVVRPTLPYRG